MTSDGDSDSAVKKKSASKGKGMNQRTGQGKESMREKERSSKASFVPDSEILPSILASASTAVPDYGLSPDHVQTSPPWKINARLKAFNGRFLQTLGLHFIYLS